jgi:very-short-patch-repair endonuclease
MQPERDPLVRDQVIRLLGVLRQLAVAKNSPTRHTSRYEKALWLDDVRDHATVQLPDGPGDELLRVPRVPREPEPQPPREIRVWLRPAPVSDEVREPTLRERGPLDGRDVYLVEAPEVQSAFDTWMTTTWRPWAETERVQRPRLRIFETLFDLSRMAADRPESIEFVLSSGLLHVPGSADEEGLHVHLITQPIRVEQDAGTGEMVCRLAEDVGVRLEDDELLSGLKMFDPSGSAVLRERLLQLAESPIAGGVATFLKEWAPRALTTATDVVDTWEHPHGPQPVLTVAPAIVARRRGAFALRAYYDAMVRALQDAAQPVPLGLAQLVRAVEPEERVAWLERAGATAPANLADDPLFPLAANEEQAQIIERLGSDTGVVVEGPPGTGKTHTIANLVSALLACGQRVLVTSEKAQALRVLRDKLPPGMQELCVSITDASPKGNSDLAKSVATMAGQRTEFHPERADRRIADLAARRADAKRKRAGLLEDIRALRESETYQHPEIAPGYGGTLANIARTLADTKERDGWVPGSERGELPLDQAEFSELVALLRAETAQRCSRRRQRFPEPQQVPRADGFVERVARVERGDAARSGREGELVTALERLPADALVLFDPVCAEVGEAAAALRALPDIAPWALRTTDMLLAGNGEHLWRQAVAQFGAVDAARDHDERADLAAVRVAPSVDPAVAAPVFERLAAHLAAGATMRRMFKGTEQKEAERFADAVLVHGTAPTTATAAAAAGHHLRVLEIAQRIDAAFHPLQMGLALTADRGPLIDAMIGLRRASVAVDRLVRAGAALGDLLTQLPPPLRPVLSTVPACERVAAVAGSVSHARSAAVAQAEIDAAGNVLLAAVPPSERPPELVALLDAMRERDPAAYESAVDALGGARREQDAQRRCDELLDSLRAASRPLAEEIAGSAENQVWDVRAARWPQAWARMCAASWTAEQTAPGRELQLDGELAATVADLHKLTGELAAERAWRSCLARMTAEQVQALQSYRNAMSNVGKGTGKLAERYRQAARDAMAVAQAAVPAWVMPIQQVLASVPADPDSFDVVIVDEASQADLTSCFLLWLAPRVIVVGDDKQCTPSEVASGAFQPIVDRLDAELGDLPSYLRMAFTPKDSIFSLLRTRFGQVVRLREHFRCMPEIITWSSNMFYRDAPLEPLRQFGADRLPPLQHTYVPGAETEPARGSVVNRVEARAIVDSVVACLDDLAYEGRTFGVVVLQGQPQADLITNELRQRISDSAWNERRLRVGSPPDFQGDERHVVWLSMVAAPNSPLRALTRRNFEQSFNVAASRAQDQLWLFHSVTPDALSQADLRHSLLTYVQSEGASAIEPVLDDVEPDRRHTAFDSLFEQRVFLDLVNRGYHVTPQVESNHRRIDLVVTGAAGKLAVECDGEAFHSTPEQRAADLDREQELKRCGWTFARVRESFYYLDKEAALAPVWAALDRLGIGPLGTITGGLWTPRGSDGEDDAPETAPTVQILSPAREPVAEAQPDSRIAQADPLAEPQTVKLVEPSPLIPASAEVPRVVLDDQRLGELGADEPVSVAHIEPDAEPEDRDLLLLAAARRPLTTNWVVEMLAISTLEARRLLSSMVERGELRRIGQTKGTRYVLPKWAEAEREGAREGNRRPRFVFGPPERRLVLQAARRRPLTNEFVRELLGVTSSMASEVLSTLVDEGLLERRGRTRATHYVLTVPRSTDVRQRPGLRPFEDLRAPDVTAPPPVTILDKDGRRRPEHGRGVE